MIIEEDGKKAQSRRLAWVTRTGVDGAGAGLCLRIRRSTPIGGAE
jgi:hypothetical protein